MDTSVPNMPNSDNSTEKEEKSKHPGGNPAYPFYETPEEMQLAIDAYFKMCDEHTEKVLTKLGQLVDYPKPIRYTVPGIAYALGFKSRHSFADTAKDRPEFSATITRARLRIESQRAADLVDPDTHNANGIKFDLTNNFDYRDESHIDHSGEMNLNETLTDIFKFKIVESDDKNKQEASSIPPEQKADGNIQGGD